MGNSAEGFEGSAPSPGYPCLTGNIPEAWRPLYIKDDRTTALVARLAETTSVTKSEAVRRAVSAELARLTPAEPLRARFAALRASHPLPAPTGEPADKAFFDALNGE